ncbi:hypothetical protein [Changpingibacter yushuensis]|uniref:hypothetical protein n=1 Tax=Changpingibacter yushuensis TaxID=2758440 RepID=UPI0015F61FF3|nr:hypothetical protein [Changpingibacter yushuensis]
MSTTPRRPAQLDAEQIESIEGESDVAYNSELAHTSAQALIPMGRNHLAEDLEAVKRIIALVDDEGVDVLAEAWVKSPENTLPGILWRGYLLREWIRREGNEVRSRYLAADSALRAKGEDGVLKANMTPKPGTVRQEWDAVLAGTFEGDFTDVLVDSARLMDVLASEQSGWILNDSHPLAHEVTRRSKALAQTSVEFRDAAALAAEGLLE